MTEVIGYGKGSNKKPFGADLADKRRVENRTLRHGKPHVYSTEEVVQYAVTMLEEKTMGLGKLRIIEKENLLKRISKDQIVVDIFDTKVSVHYSTDRSRVFEVSISDLVLQAIEALGELPPSKEPSERRAYNKAPEGCVGVEHAAAKLGTTPARLYLLLPEMKSYGFTVNLVEEGERKFIRRADLDRMIGIKPRLVAFLEQKRKERTKQ